MLVLILVNGTVGLFVAFGAIGEHGLMLALVTAVAAFFFWRKRGSLPQAQVQCLPKSCTPIGWRSVGVRIMFRLTVTAMRG